MNDVRAGLFENADQARASLSAAKSDKTDSAGRFALSDIIAEGMPVRLHDGAGRTLAAYVVQPFGRALWITAAAGRAGFPLCPVIDAFATAQAREAGYEAVGFRTERPGLVLRARRLGYVLTRQEGPTHYMRKNLK